MSLELLRNVILYLPESLRSSLKPPKGELFSRKALGAAKDTCAYIKQKKLHPVIAVGDMVSINLDKASCQATVSIMDGKTKRHETLDYELATDVVFKVANPAGQIRPEVWIAIEHALSLGEKGKRAKIFIEGEEDLTALPAVVLSPIGAAVVYGLPGKGIVVIEVTNTQKQEVNRIMQQMMSQ
ncbi:MAG: GTP-dependent dephospho-CoA kinase family protein [Promethearchaeota archaeon]